MKDIKYSIILKGKNLIYLESGRGSLSSLDKKVEGLTLALSEEGQQVKQQVYIYGEKGRELYK